jgi:hypothetical protein
MKKKRRVLWGIRYKMFILNTIAGVLLLSMLGGGVVAATDEFVTKDYRRSAAMSASLLMTSIDSQVNEMKNILITMSLDPNLLSFADNTSGYELDVKRLRFLEYADGLVRTKNHLTYYVFNRSKPYAWSNISTEATTNYLRSAMTDNWLSLLSENPADLVPLPTFHALKSASAISYAYALRLQPHGFWQDTFLLVSLDSAFFDNLISTVKKPAADMLLVADNNGNIAYSTGFSRVQAGKLHRELIKQKGYVLVETVSRINGYSMSEDGFLLEWWGVKDKHWEFNADNKVVDTKDCADRLKGDWNARAHEGIQWYTGISNYDLIVKYTAPTTFDLRSDMVEGWKNIGTEYPVAYNANPNRYITPGPVEMQNTIGYTERWRQMIHKAVTGKDTDIEKTVMDWIAAEKAMGYDQIKAERTELCKKVQMDFNK